MQSLFPFFTTVEVDQSTQSDPDKEQMTMLESLQLFRFIMTEQRIDIPAIKKIQTDSSSSNEKAAMFLRTVEDDPSVLAALRKAKKELDRGAPSGPGSCSLYLQKLMFLFYFIYRCHWPLV